MKKAKEGETAVKVSIPEKREIPFEAWNATNTVRETVAFQSLRKGKYPSKELIAQLKKQIAECFNP